MKHDIKTYVILAAIFLLSIAVASYIDASELIKALVGAPGVFSLLAALYQLARDQATYEKQLDIQQRQFQFTLGAASHMANLAFDKHMEFCEKYMAEIHEVMSTLFIEGETPGALVHAGNLYKLRQDYAVWLTDEINENLSRFEDALRKLGTNAQFIQKNSDHGQYTKIRLIKINENDLLFSEILGSDGLNEKYAIEAIKKKVKAILGVEELTKLRTHLVIQASNVLKST